MINLPFKKILLSNAPIEVIEYDKNQNDLYKTEVQDNGYCLVLNSSNVTSHGFDFEKTCFITKEIDESLTKGKLKRGDIVLITQNCSENNLGNVGFYDENIEYENIRINSKMVILRTKDNLLSKFLYYFLQTNYFKKVVNTYKHVGYINPVLPLSSFKDIEFYLPTLSQQKDIVEFISLFDKKIEIYKKINDNLENQIKTIFNSFFVFYDNYSKDELKECKIGLCPKQWNLVSLEKVTTEIKEKAGNNEYKLLSFNNCGNLILSEDYEKQDFNNHVDKIVVKQKEFIYDSYRIHRGVIRRNNYDVEGCIDSRYIAFKVEDDYENFMEMYFKSNIFNQWIDILPFYSGRRTLHYHEFSLIKIAYPPKRIINKFNKIYKKYYEVITHNTCVINNLRKTKNILLPKLISGEITISRD